MVVAFVHNRHHSHNDQHKTKSGMQAQAPRHGLPRQVLFGAIAGLRKLALTLDFLWQFQLKSLTGLSPGQTHVIQTPIANHAWALPQPQAALPWAHRRPRARNASIVPEGRISLGGSEHAGFVFFRLVEIMTTSKMQPMSRRSAPGINGRSQAETPRPKQHKLVKRKNMYQRHDMFCRGLLQYGVAGTDHKQLQAMQKTAEKIHRRFEQSRRAKAEVCCSFRSRVPFYG